MLGLAITGGKAIAASLLQRAGFDVINMAGGFAAWQQAGLPVATETAREPRACRVN